MHQVQPISKLVIELLSPLAVEANTEDGTFKLVFWQRHSFPNYTKQFRSLLSDIAEELGQNPRLDLSLPAYEQREDFVEGTLQVGAEVLQVYFEYALGYLALMGKNESVLRNVAHRLLPRIVIVGSS